ncbi:endonuclease/exonuclease/phosphatase family protein [Rhodopirellula islandica]|nr:endonuclease/exonuclease/phosphatase family protein [Rhodopirellula islandica]
MMRSCGQAWLAVLAALAMLIGVATLEAAEPVQVRVLCYNIHHGEGVDGKLDLERIAKVIQSVHPDVVTLQEVDQNASRSGSVDQPAELSRLTGMQVAFGANIPLQGGHYGNAVLSKYPIVDHRNQHLPNFDNGEQRGVLSAELEIPGLDEPLLLLATHLDSRRKDGERIASAKAINQIVSQTLSRPALLAGDMNDVLNSPTLNELDASWTRANEQALPTIPVANPQRQIDFILFRPSNHWKVIQVKVLDEAVASDHRPIFAVLELIQ